MKIEEDLKIVSLKIKNVKKIELANIKLDKDCNVIHIKGPNGAGKSTIIDSIVYALNKKMPTEVITHGKKNSEIFLDMDSLTVRYRCKDNGGQQLEVRDKAGLKFDKSRDVLSRLIGPITLDPDEFLKMPRKEQAELLRKVLGVDTSKLDLDRKKKYDERTIANANMKRVQALFDSMQEIDAPDEEVNINTIQLDIRHAEEIRKSNDKCRNAVQIQENELKTISINIETTVREIQKLKQQLKSQEEILETYQTRLINKQKEIEITKEGISKLKDPDVSELTNKISEIQETNKKVRSKKERIKTELELNKAQTDWQSLEDKIKEIDDNKKKLLEEAKSNLPIEDVDLTEDGIIFKGFPLEQCSTAQQLGFAIAIGAITNKNLKIILFRHGGLLDATSIGVVEQIAKYYNLQVWIESPTDEGELLVINEDGDNLMSKTDEVEIDELPEKKDAIESGF